MLAKCYINFAPPRTNNQKMKSFIQQIDAYKLPEDNIIIGDDLALISIKTFAQGSTTFEPHKLTHAVIIICTSGSARIKVNLQEYNIEAPKLITLMPGQIGELLEKSSDFGGYAIALSRRFIDMVNFPGWQRQYMTLYNNPISDIDEDIHIAMRTFYAILYRAAANDKNPFRLQVIENLIRAFYYGGISSFGSKSSNSESCKNNIVERFIELVQTHYREERLIGFYANKLCITPKYLSKLVKENTGRSAGEWIESHVILEARAMLQSSEITIQQIATSLNFPNQSFFGKYFKRATGLSPKQFRSKS